MNYNCPWCNEDLEEWTTKNDISPYGQVFNCPKCKKGVHTNYDESWDGKEEISYYSLSKSELE
jgi:transcription initiation factor IIE alpha subunit